MRRVILAIATTAIALVLLLTFKTHAATVTPVSIPPAVAGSPTPGVTSPGGTGSPSPESPARSSPTATGTHPSAVTATGKVVQTIYGPVQVKITVTSGRITAATAVQYPSGTPRDDQINSYAIPQLNAAAVAAGNANINAVSGATYTSAGYIGSLQSALDQVKGA